MGILKIARIFRKARVKFQDELGEIGIARLPVGDTSAAL
jgi:hypothetical protein